MQVLCIKTIIGFSIRKMCFKPGPHPKEGEVYEVVDSKPGYYKLTLHDKYFYSESNFIPLSDIDETEIKRSIYQPLN